MSDIPSKFNENWYDENYFRTPEGKKYQYGEEVRGWSYANPDGEFHGAGPVAKAWKEVFQPKDLLDVGAGRGTFITYARDVGIQAIGFDYSKWAVSDEGRYPRCERDWLIEHDATKRWPWGNEQFELIVALDFYEHIYEEDLGGVIAEMYRVAERYVFLQIATAGSGGLQGKEEKGYILKKGEPVPPELEVCAVAGHVTVQPPSFWHDRLEHEDWMPRRDMVQHFISLVDNRIIQNWLLNTIIVMERI